MDVKCPFCSVPMANHRDAMGRCSDLCHVLSSVSWCVAELKVASRNATPVAQLFIDNAVGELERVKLQYEKGLQRVMA